MQLHFMKYRKLSYWISGALVLISILSLGFRGLNYGIDFAGGISMEVSSKASDYTIDKMRKDLAAFKPELQSVSGGNVLVRIGLEKGASEDMQNKAVADIKNIFGDRVSYNQVQIVGPKIGGELIRGGILAVLFSFLLMSLYVWIRYKGGYAVGSLISLVLDFILMFGFFSVIGMEFNQTSIAVILMGIGYSINDKVVNYDRIEENAKRYHKMPQGELIDLSVNEMLRRTVLTSTTTLLGMIALYLFSGSALQDFSLSMIFAIIMGTLTSVYISNVVLYHFDLRKDN
ncbi:MAG: protein translocase subunit SecF [Alphaproteobacteria bacterium]